MQQGNADENILGDDGIGQEDFFRHCKIPVNDNRSNHNKINLYYIWKNGKWTISVYSVSTDKNEIDIFMNSIIVSKVKTNQNSFDGNRHHLIILILSELLSFWFKL